MLILILAREVYSVVSHLLFTCAGKSSDGYLVVRCEQLMSRKFTDCCPFLRIGKYANSLTGDWDLHLNCQFTPEHVVNCKGKFPEYVVNLG